MPKGTRATKLRPPEPEDWNPEVDRDPGEEVHRLGASIDRLQEEMSNLEAHCQAVREAYFGDAESSPPSTADCPIGVIPYTHYKISLLLEAIDRCHLYLNRFV